jgi:transposase
MNKPEDGHRQDDLVAFVGMDWADQKHDVWIRDAETQATRHQVIKQSPEGLSGWASELRQQYPQGQIGVALEQSRGALIYGLMEYPFLVLYPVNPLSLARYREAFKPSRAKDDPSDAEFLGEMLAQHRDRLKPWRPDDEQTRLLGLLNEGRRHAVDLRTKLVEQLIATLKKYFPQALELIGKQWETPIASDFLLRWPELGSLQRAKPQSVRSFYFGHNCRNTETIEHRLELIKQAKPLTTDGAIITSGTMTVKLLATQIRHLNQAVVDYEKQIAKVFAEHPDADIFESFPGAAKAIAPRLLCLFGTDRDRFDSATEVQNFSGIAPVTERSGKHEWIHWRWNAPAFVRQSVHEFAKCSIPQCAWAAAYYAMQRDRGKGHHAAVRALGFKWLRILFRCWKERVRYDEALYLQSLIKRGSEIVKYMAARPEEKC